MDDINCVLYGWKKKKKKREKKMHVKNDPWPYLSTRDHNTFAWKIKDYEPDSFEKKKCYFLWCKEDAVYFS